MPPKKIIPSGLTKTTRKVDEVKKYKFIILLIKKISPKKKMKKSSKKIMN